MVRPLTLMCTFRPLKPCGRFSGELTSQNVDEILRRHDSALPHQCENTVSHHKTLRWTVLSHLPYSPDLDASDFHFFQAPSKMPSLGKGFGSNDEAIKEWLRVQNSHSYKKGSHRHNTFEVCGYCSAKCGV
jgi:hypothetical protein